MKITDKGYFCIMSSSIWQLMGYVLFALKVVVPLIIIILGVMDFVKAMTSSKDEAIISAAKNLGLRLVIGLVIFFVPLIISTIFKFVKEASVSIAAADACQRCLLQPFTAECEGYKAVAKEQREAEKENLSQGSGGYKVEINHCYFVYNSGDTMGKYVWGKEGTAGYNNVAMADQYTNKAACTNSDNPISVFNYTQKPNEIPGGMGTNGDYLKYNGSLIILHSGQGEGRDNTLELFEAASKAKFYAAECDVRNDGSNLYCSHSTTLTNATKFADYIDVCRKYGMMALLDIKWDYSYNLIAEYIKNNNLQNSVIVQTGDINVMNQINAITSGLKYWYLATDITGYQMFNNDILKYKNIGVVGVNLAANVATEDMIKNMKSNNLTTCVYSLDSDALKTKYSGYGAEYIMTNVVP